ncbi:MAG TPA: hypothetical protein VH331_03760 [Allosphingosinicella sp.]|jgi:hypothetical protein|nr:hypothetical protein [Allosphingosinicella sp.]
MKIAICIPRYGDTKGEFTVSLSRMVIKTLSAAGAMRPEIEIFSVTSSDLPVSRNLLLKRAIEWQAHYLLWLDADHIFPAQSLIRLLSHRLPVVGCNYSRRREPAGPVAVRVNEAGEREHVWTTEELARTGVVEEVVHVGLGLCLMDMAILHQVKEHVEKGVGWADWNPFDRKLLPGTTTRMGEDASFFEELREAGVKVYVDHALSWYVGHIGEHIFTNEDAERDRGAFLSAG